MWSVTLIASRFPGIHPAMPRFDSFAEVWTKDDGLEGACKSEGRVVAAEFERGAVATWTQFFGHSFATSNQRRSKAGIARDDNRECTRVASDEAQ